MKKMYTPLQIAGMEIKNRTFMAPMSLGYESQDGTVNEKMAGYWLRRAKGGVGCIIVDATSVDPNAVLEIHFVSGMKRASKSIKVLQIRSMRMGVRLFRRSHTSGSGECQRLLWNPASGQQCISKRNGADDKRAGKRGTAGDHSALCQSR